MAVHALKPGYTGQVRDRVENFHGRQLLYVGWHDHLSFGAAHALALTPDTPFSALVENILPGVYAQHPDTARIDWKFVQWFRSSQPFTPELDKSLADNGLGHKAAIWFSTPGLNGVNGTHN